ncbi:bifunctional endoribonuclease/protein kinase IRE1 NDAI_0C01890 [Naumovozyma dairenensis CBS 421]|uniref:non-specific serine/threonine protein kinase n=1 Tax=Naumovozyma dairenensis (strain ATCC 10597 / BCRC 20456 / CBS 421 / NBRC 0211 / NRRL Y-12639) TaxID=1071378 RepID=G0W7T8_NAUDC|nr:hypothetical protein NDAI_0C01890 [Naumovozyma dairenensis CBS 421]CCD23849.1 hypothetical protein NDAI_0C01890 [Naumovozyma dairenensis CBS 421]
MNCLKRLILASLVLIFQYTHVVCAWKVPLWNKENTSISLPSEELISEVTRTSSPKRLTTQTQSPSLDMRFVSYTVRYKQGTKILTSLEPGLYKTHHITRITTVDANYWRTRVLKEGEELLTDESTVSSDEELTTVAEKISPISEVREKNQRQTEDPVPSLIPTSTRTTHRQKGRTRTVKYRGQTLTAYQSEGEDDKAFAARLIKARKIKKIANNRPQSKISEVVVVNTSKTGTPSNKRMIDDYLESSLTKKRTESVILNIPTTKSAVTERSKSRKFIRTPIRSTSKGKTKSTANALQGKLFSSRSSVSTTMEHALKSTSHLIKDLIREKKEHSLRSSTIKSLTVPYMRARTLNDLTLSNILMRPDIEGGLHALDRENGQLLWSIEAEQFQPLLDVVEPSRSTINETLIVEPYGDGNIYYFNVHQGLQKIPVTIRQLILTSPMHLKTNIVIDDMGTIKEDEKIYTGSRKTIMYTIDARNGEIISAYGPGTANKVFRKDKRASCVDEHGEKTSTNKYCKNVIVIGKTIYQLGIHSLDGTEYNITYASWQANSLDVHLNSENKLSKDGIFIAPFRDKSLLAVDADFNIARWISPNFPGIIVGIFDVFVDDQLGENVLVPHPFNSFEDTDFNATEKLYLDQTKNHSWFALSYEHFPSLVRAAPISKYETSPKWRVSSIFANENLFKTAIVGVHNLLSSNYEQFNERPVHMVEAQEPQTRKALQLDSSSNDIRIPPENKEPDTVLSREELEEYRVRMQEEITKEIMDKYDFSLVFVVGRFIYRILESGLILLSSLFLLTILQKLHLAPPLYDLLAKMGLLPTPTNEKIELIPSPVEEEIKEIVETKVNVGAPPDDHLNIAFEPSTTSAEYSINSGEEGFEYVGKLASNNPTTEKKKRKRGSRGSKKNKRKGQSSNVEVERQQTAEEQQISQSQEIDIQGVASPVPQRLSSPILPRISSPIPSRVSSPIPPRASSPVPGQIRSIDGINYEHVLNNLEVSNKILGYGSSGTVVFQGTFQNRPVAVKRMLIDFCDIASREIKLLTESDDHKNVVRYYCSETTDKFLYIALELCTSTLQDLIEMKNPTDELRRIQKLLDPIDILSQIGAGVAHLHSLKIIHRDIKPQNILVAISKKAAAKNQKDTQQVRVMISDFGLCKKLDAEQSSFRTSLNNPTGTSGWRAPELLEDTAGQILQTLDENNEFHLAHGSHHQNNSILSSDSFYDPLTKQRLTRAIDIFSMGCVFYYVLSKGNHPFGARYIREGNIIKGRYDLHGLKSTLRDRALRVEAADLIEQMISNDPKRRPSAFAVLQHPVFWLSAKKLEFLLKVSDRFEIERRDPPSPLLLKLESHARVVFPHGDWSHNFDKAFMDNLGKYRKYSASKLMDLLRALRNKYHHFMDLPQDLAQIMGPIPNGFYKYFSRRFPKLLMEVYHLTKDELSDDLMLHEFFE